MSDELKPCPCGQVGELLIECARHAKYGTVGCECGDWMTEFRNNYATNPDDIRASAVRAWNAARRPAPSERLPRELVEQVEIEIAFLSGRNEGPDQRPLQVLRDILAWHYGKPAPEQP